MQKTIKKQNIILVLFLILFGLTVGYALLSQNITLNGSTTIPNSSWSIHFVPTTYQEATGSVVGTVSYADNNTKLTFNDTLSIPGDFYEFTIDIINDGGVDGMLDIVPALSIVDNKGTDDTSDDTAYTSTDLITSSITYYDDSPINQYEELKVGKSEKIKVRIEFKKDINNSDLNNLPLHLTCNLNPVYVQADNNASIRPKDYLKIVSQEDDLTIPAFENNEGITKEQVEKIYTLNTLELPNNLQSSIIKSWDVSEKGNGSIMAYALDTDTNSKYEIYIGQNGGVKANPNSGSLFNHYSNATEIDLSNLIVYDVESMNSMFYNDYSLTSLDVSSFNTSNVTNMSWMFGNLYNIESLDKKNGLSKKDKPFPHPKQTQILLPEISPMFLVNKFYE